ncbi:hypothetical protein FOQG_17094 [Fusarium oxysporum f. sp. raphani 54005]|uniref:Uncharacterized protein n=1 Tax=Fusarium oxysporum f. sp. raphani 54005 TaxID=1089458 RepID=X0BHB4_FUSOX|nr:hypothetical protein FOQG_17094 [Fusarium oxysporum f. sp. raphani 54005]
MDSENARYDLVESLYGPGTVIAWLLAIASVIITWTVDKKCRRRDNLSVDFVAVALFPMVASSHLIFQVSRLPVTVAKVVTSEDANFLQLTAAIEAPLNICETFWVVSLLLAVLCSGWEGGPPKWKRLAIVLFMGVLSWATENLMFATATIKGVKVSDATLSRPYLFFLTPIVVSTWVLLLSSGIIGVGVWLAYTIVEKTGNGNENREGLRPDSDGKFILEILQHETAFPGSLKDQRARTRRGAGLVSQQTKRNSVGMKLMAGMTMFYFPWTFIAALFSVVLFETKQVSQSTSSRQMQLIQTFFLPISKESILQLDQVLALTTGVLTLIFTIWSAYHSRGALISTRAPVRGNIIQRRKSI